MLFGEGLELAGGHADVRADHDESPRRRRGVAFVSFLRGQRGADFLADAAADERRAHAVQELLAAAFRFLQAEGQGTEVILGDDVGHDRGGVGGGFNGIRDCLGGDGGVRCGCTGTNDVEVQDDHGVGGEPALRLLLHIFGHLGVGEPEACVLGEFRLGHGRQAAGVGSGAAHVVHAANGDPAGVGECRNDHDAVGGLAGLRGDCGGNDVRFQRVVAAEGGIAAADEPQAQAGSVLGTGCGQCVADDFLVACGGFCRVQAAGVREHVDGGLGLVLPDVGEGPGEVGHVPAGEDRKVRDGLRAGGVVVEHYEHPG